jgi:hypothetical protein
MHGNVPANPARGEAQGRIGPSAHEWLAGADRRRESKTRSRSHLIPGRPLLQIYFLQQAIGHPDENQSGRNQRHERQVGPDRQKCRGDKWAGASWPLAKPPDSSGGIVHPHAGSNLRRAHELNPMNAVGRRTQRREGPASPGQAVLQLERVAERHAKKARFGE